MIEQTITGIRTLKFAYKLTLNVTLSDRVSSRSDCTFVFSYPDRSTDLIRGRRNGKMEDQLFLLSHIIQFQARDLAKSKTYIYVDNGEICFSLIECTCAIARKSLRNREKMLLTSIFSCPYSFQRPSSSGSGLFTWATQVIKSMTYQVVNGGKKTTKEPLLNIDLTNNTEAWLRLWILSVKKIPIFPDSYIMYISLCT